MKITEAKALAIFNEVVNDCFVVAWNHMCTKDPTAQYKPFRKTKEFRRAFYTHAAVHRLLSMETYNILCAFTDR